MAEQNNQPAETPIIVNGSAIPATILTVLRYVLTALGGVLVTNNVLPTDTNVDQIVGAFLILAATVWGAYRSKTNNDQKVTMAEKLPDRIAEVV